MHATAFALLLLALPGRAEAQTTDAKVWSSFTGKVDLAERLRFNAEHQVRLGAATGVEKSLSDFELRLRPIDLIQVGAGYRLIGTNDDGFWHRGSLNIGLDHDLGRFGLSYLLRLQSTVRSTETVSAVRNKLGVDFDAGKGLTPGAAFELHYSTTNSEFREARLVLGVDKKLSKKWEVGVSYMLQSEFNKQASETNHVLRLGASYLFRKRSNKKDRNSAD